MKKIVNFILVTIAFVAFCGTFQSCETSDEDLLRAIFPNNSMTLHFGDRPYLNESLLGDRIITRSMPDISAVSGNKDLLSISGQQIIIHNLGETYLEFWNKDHKKLGRVEVKILPHETQQTSISASIGKSIGIEGLAQSGEMINYTVSNSEMFDVVTDVFDRQYLRPKREGSAIIKVLALDSYNHSTLYEVNVKVGPRNFEKKAFTMKMGEIAAINEVDNIFYPNKDFYEISSSDASVAELKYDNRKWSIEAYKAGTTSIKFLTKSEAYSQDEKGYIIDVTVKESDYDDYKVSLRKGSMENLSQLFLGRFLYYKNLKNSNTACVSAGISENELTLLGLKAGESTITFLARYNPWSDWTVCRVKVNVFEDNTAAATNSGKTLTVYNGSKTYLPNAYFFIDPSSVTDVWIADNTVAKVSGNYLYGVSPGITIITFYAKPQSTSTTYEKYEVRAVVRK